jgi:hypothetical protein
LIGNWRFLDNSSIKERTIGFGFFLSGNILRAPDFVDKCKERQNPELVCRIFFSFLVLLFPLIAECSENFRLFDVLHTISSRHALCKKLQPPDTKASKRGAHRKVHLFDVFAHNQFSSCIVLLELLQE